MPCAIRIYDMQQLTHFIFNIQSHHFDFTICIYAFPNTEPTQQSYPCAHTFHTFVKIAISFF